MIRSFFRGKRGVSEIIASLIIVLIVTVTGTVLYSYSLDAFSSSSSSFQLQTSQSEEQEQERISIIAVWWDGISQLNLTVLNYGKIELAIDAVYIDGRQVSASTYTNGKGETIAVRSRVSVKFTSPISIIDGYTYEISAVSERGSRDVFYWKA